MNLQSFTEAIKNPVVSALIVAIIATGLPGLIGYFASNRVQKKSN